MKFIITGESAHWCGFKEHRIVEAKTMVEAKTKLEESNFEEFMRGYIGEPDDYEQEDWADDPDEYAVVTFTIDEYYEAEHGSEEYYEAL
jgi:hypothetical protein